jgi:hypothetical protein
MQSTLHNASTTVVAGFKALSDPIRLQVLELLREQEMCVCDLCDLIDVSPNPNFPSTSKPLNLLVWYVRGKKAAGSTTA